MLNLVLKDFLNLKRVLWLPLLYGFIFLYAFHTMEGAALIAVTIAVNYTLMLQACAFDDKSRSDLLLLSLPISRQTVVRAKYLSAFLYAFLGILTYVLAWGIYHFFPISFSLPKITLMLLVEGFVLAVLLNSLYYPVFFKFGHLKSNTYAVIIFMLFTFVPAMLLGLVKRGSQNPFFARLVEAVKPWLAAAPNSPAVLLLTIAFFLLAFSYRLSLYFYEKREF